MTDEQRPVPGRDEAPAVAVETARGISIVWLIPIVAALVAAWLAWSTISARGPTISISFQTASGLEAGKTEVKYRSVTLGLVKDVDLSDDLTHVIVTAQMDKDATDHLTDGTQFWVESPQISASGVSGLSTLVSGVYIGMLPGHGKPKREFEGVPTPPVLDVSVPGRRFQLKAQALGSISAGSPIFYRGIRVGEILGYSLDVDASGVTMLAFIRAPHDALIRDGTNFWNASGIDLSLSASGVKLRTASLLSILEGGVAFDTPREASGGAPSKEDSAFPLFASYESIREASFTQKVPFLLHFEGSVSGLEVGAPVMIRGIQIGEVTDIGLEVDVSKFDVHIPVRVELEPQRARIVGGEIEDGHRLVHFVEHGLRAQLQSGNLLTGSLVIELDFFRDEPKMTIAFEDGLPVIPTIPSDVQLLKQKATVFLDHLAKAPIPELVADLRTTVDNVDRILTSKGVQQGTGELIESLKQTVDVARLTLEKADRTLGSADQMIGPDSALRFDLVRLIQELTETARSVRALTGFLERDPSALILGKDKPGDE